MRLVHFADLHLDAQFSWLGADAQAARERRQALRDTLGQIVALAREVDATAVLCGGDLYEHERVSADTGAFLRQTFAALDPVRVYIAPGNHDWNGPQSLYQQVSWSSNVHIFTSGRLEPVSLGAGVILWGAAHRGPANAPNFLEGFAADRGDTRLALFHGSEQGWLAGQEQGKAVHGPFWAEQIASAGLHHVFLGHYHRPQAAERYTYPGNPDPLTFGEDGKRGAVVVDVAEDGGVTRQWRRVATSHVRDICLDLTGCASGEDVRRRLAAHVGTDPGFVRVTLSGDLHPDIDLDFRDLKTAVPHVRALVVQFGDVHPAYDFDAIQQEQTVRGQFARDVVAAGLEEAQRRRVLVTGLRALAQRSDLDVR